MWVYFLQARSSFSISVDRYVLSFWLQVIRHKDKDFFYYLVNAVLTLNMNDSTTSYIWKLSKIQKYPNLPNY